MKNLLSIKNIFIVFIVLSVFFIPNVSATGGWWIEGDMYAGCMDVAIDNTGSSILNDFPLFVNITYDSDMQADFDDIRILDEPCGEGGDLLSYEIDTYSDSSYMALWVKIPMLPESGKTMSIYYGNSEVGSGEDASNVWDDSYLSVYHLSHTSGNAVDSIGFLSGTENFDPDSNMNAGGVVGKGDYFDGSDDITITDWEADGTNGVDHTYCAWVKYTSSDQGIILEDGGSTDGDGLGIDSGNLLYGASTTSGEGNGMTAESAVAYNDGDWHYVCGVYSTSSIMILYVDGVQETTQTGFDGSVGTGDGGIGNQNSAGNDGVFDDSTDHYFTGTMDEIRISSDERSADWIKMSYDAVANQETTVVMTDHPYKEPWYEFPKCKDITITSASVENLSNYPAYIRIPYDSDMQADFDDIRFVDAGCNSEGDEIPYEMELYSVSDTAYVWVKIPSLPTTGKTISVYYGNSNAFSKSSPEAIWDENYSAVWHLGRTHFQDEAWDSTANGNDLYGYGIVDTVVDGGQIGAAVDCEGVGGYDAFRKEGGFTNMPTYEGTIEAYVYRNFGDVDAQPPILISNSTGSRDNGPSMWWFGYGLYDTYFALDDTGSSYAVMDSGAFTNGNWALLTATWSDTAHDNEQKLYVDKTLVETDSPRYAWGGEIDRVSIINKLDTGVNSGWGGYVDEIRLSKTIRSEGWINQTHSNLVDYSSTVSVGSEEQVPVVLVSPSDESDVFYGTREFSCNADISGTLQNISFYGGYNGEFNLISTNSSPSEGVDTSFTYNLGLTGDFTWNCKACDTLGTCYFGYSNYTVTANDYWLADYTNCRNITIDSDPTLDTLESFPAYVELDYYTGMQTDFDDIRFVTGGCRIDGDLMDYEIENYTSSSKAYVWLRIPSLPSDGVTIAMYYNNSAVSSGANQEGVWDQYYSAVWHMDGDTLTETDDIFDSTSNDNDLVDGNYKVDSTVDSEQIGNARYETLGGYNHMRNEGGLTNMPGYQGTIMVYLYKNFGDVTTYPPIIATNSTGADDFGPSIGWHASTYTTYFKYESASGWTVDDDGDFDYGEWGVISATWSDTAHDNFRAFYLNGTLIEYSTSEDVWSGEIDKLVIGNNLLSPGYGTGWGGTIDEVRFSTIPRSASWIKETSNLIMDQSSYVTISDDPYSEDYWSVNDFSICRNIYIKNAGSTQLDNFPAYINLSFDDDMQADFDDIRFRGSPCDQGGTQLDYEIENYTSSTNAHVWVKIPSILTSGTTISVYYGNSTVGSGENPVDVWNDNYIAVYHMNEPTLNDDAIDVLGNLTLPPYDDIGPYDGIVAGGREHVSYGGGWSASFRNTSTDLTPRNKGTVELWINQDFDLTSSYGWGAIGYRYDNANRWQLDLDTNDDQMEWWFEPGDTPRYVTLDYLGARNTWTYAALAWEDGSYGDFYYAFTNGKIDHDSGSPASLGTMSTAAAPFNLGADFYANYAWPGVLDEIRLSKTARSVDWLNQTYQMIKNQGDYVTFSGETMPGWWNNSFTHCKTITLVSDVDTDLENFPYYINLEYDSDMQADFDDIRFVSTSCDNGGSLLDYEVESYTASTDADIWVRIPELDDEDGATISVYYGNAGATSAENPTDVWDDDYETVWHFAGSGSIMDSTDNDNDKSLPSSWSYTCSYKYIDGSVCMDSAGIGDGDSITTGVSDGSDWTVEFWIRAYSNPSGEGSNDKAVLYTDYWGGLVVGSNGNPPDREIEYIHYNSDDGYRNDYTGSIGYFVWDHFVLTSDWNGGGSGISRFKLYKDGELISTFDETNDATPTGINFGTNPSFYQSGASYDEFRASTKVRDDDWIKQTYYVMDNTDCAVHMTDEVNRTDYDSYWYDSGLAYCMDFVLKNAGDTALSDYPAYVKIQKDPAMQADFGDLRFVNNSCGKSGDLMNFDIDEYSATEVHAWVGVDSLPASGYKAFSVYFGNSTLATAESSDVWTDAGYVGVWHMSETARTTGDFNDVEDSTGTGNDCEFYNGSDSDMDGRGFIGTGQDFYQYSEEHLNCDDDPSLDFMGDFSTEAWVYSQDGEYEKPVITRYTWASSTCSYGWFLAGSGTTSDLYFSLYESCDPIVSSQAGIYDFYNESDAHAYNSWEYVAGVFDAGNYAKMYINGSTTDTWDDTSAISSLNTRAYDDLYIGTTYDSHGADAWWQYFFNGSLDEVRLASGVAFSQDWINQTYMSVAHRKCYSRNRDIHEYPGSVTLNSPAHGNQVDIGDTNFQCTVSLTNELASVSLLTDMEGSFSIVDTKTNVANGDTVTLTATSSLSGDYTWTCMACDIYNKCIQSSDTWSVSVSAAGWPTENYRKCRTIELKSVADSTLENIQYYINLDFPTMQEDYDDVVFYDTECGSIGNLLSYEKASYDDDGGHFWVKIPSLPTTGKKISVYYGNTTASSGSNPGNTWGGDYLGVWHLDETSGTHADSSGNGNTGTNSGSTQDAEGVVGKANDFDGSDDGISTTANIDQSSGNSVTMCAWVNFDSTSGSQMIISSDDGGYDWMLRIYDGEWDTPTGSGYWDTNMPLETDEWHYACVVYDSNYGIIQYVDGLDIANTTTIGYDTSDADLSIGMYPTGTYPVDGTIDEVMALSDAKDKNWIDQMYNMMNSPHSMARISDPSDRFIATGFTKCREISISNAGSSTLENFPAYINLTYDEDMRTDMGDVRFMSGDCGSSGTLLPYELEGVDAGVSGHFWVKIPSLPTEGTTISVYYGDPALKNGEDPDKVWDNGYVYVEHFDEKSGDHEDSTRNNNFVWENDNLEQQGVDSDIVYTADEFSGTVNNPILVDAETDSINSLTNALTVEAWVKQDDTARKRIITTNTEDWVFRCDGSGILHFYNKVGSTYYHTKTTTGIMPADTWMYVAVSWAYSGNKKPILYKDGIVKTMPTNDAITSTLENDGTQFCIGCSMDYASERWAGWMDEVRISNVSRSADWILQSYSMVDDNPSYVTINSEESVSGLWWNDSYSYCKDIDIKSAVTSNLKDFPLHIRVPYDSNMQTDFDDVRFVLSKCNQGGTLLDYEKDSYTSSDEAHFWVRIPNYEPDGLNLAMYYGNPTVENEHNKEQVWANNYETVWHFANNLSDSTANDNDPSGSSSMSYSYTDSVVGDELDVDAAYGDCALDTGLVDSSTQGQFTLSFWYVGGGDADLGGSYVNEIIGTGTPADSLRLYGSGGQPTDDMVHTFCYNDACKNYISNIGDSAYGDFEYVTFTYDWDGYSSTQALITLYKNGFLQGSLGKTQNEDPGDTILLGHTWYSYHADLRFDELRASNVVRTVDWIRQEAATMKDYDSYVTIHDSSSQWVSSYTRCKNVTITNPSGVPLVDYMLYVNPTYDSDMQTNFSDIRFYGQVCGMGGEALPYELENYTSSDEAHFWVNIKSLPAEGKTISMYYGNASASSASTSTNVWNEGAQPYILHFEETTGSTETSSQSGSVYVNIGGSKIDQDVEGIVGSAIEQDGGSESDSVISSSWYGAFRFYRTDYTTRYFWLNRVEVYDSATSTCATSDQKGIYMKSSQCCDKYINLGYGIEDNTPTSYSEPDDRGTKLNEWQQIVIAYNRYAGFDFYRDGRLIRSMDSDLSDDLYVDRFGQGYRQCPINAVIDEYRQGNHDVVEPEYIYTDFYLIKYNGNMVVLGDEQQEEEGEGECQDSADCGTDFDCYSNYCFKQGGRFVIKDSSNNDVAIMDRYGQMGVKGDITESCTTEPSGSNDFQVRTSADAHVAWIDATTGNFCIKGSVSEDQSSLAPSGDNDFVLKNSTDDVVMYIDGPTGNLYIKKKLLDSISFEDPQ